MILVACTHKTVLSLLMKGKTAFIFLAICTLSTTRRLSGNYKRVQLYSAVRIKKSWGSDIFPPVKYMIRFV